MHRSLTAAAILSIATFASANTLFYDGFNYPYTTPTATPLEGQGPWQAPVPRTPPMTIASGSLNDAGFPTLGKSVQLNNAIGDTVAIGLTPITTGTVYYSMLVQINSAVTTTNQSYFAGFDDSALVVDPQSTAIGSGAALVVRRNTTDNSKVDLGIAAPGNNNTTKIYSATPINPADNNANTLFVVGSYTFNTVTNKDDVMKLYVFPTNSTIPSSAPAPSASATTAPGNTDLTQVSRFYLRDNTGLPSSILVDEVRIGTSWTDILPLDGDPNLNGRIDADDYGLIDRGYARYQSGAIAPNAAVRTDGDLNADGKVDASDYALIDQAFVARGGSFSPGLLAEREAIFGDAYVSGLVSIPEPAGTALFTLVPAAIAGRRKRR